MTQPFQSPLFGRASVALILACVLGVATRDVPTENGGDPFALGLTAIAQDDPIQFMEHQLNGCVIDLRPKVNLPLLGVRVIRAEANELQFELDLDARALTTAVDLAPVDGNQASWATLRAFKQVLNKFPNARYRLLLKDWSKDGESIKLTIEESTEKSTWMVVNSVENRAVLTIGRSVADLTFTPELRLEGGQYQSGRYEILWIHYQGRRTGIMFRD